MVLKSFAANMWPAYTFANPNQLYQDFLSIGRPRFKGFLESILLHDEVHVPTDSFMSLALLVGVLGEDPINELLDNGVLKFFRFEGSLAYIGNGGGLLPYTFGKKGASELKPIPTFGPADEAIDWALSGLKTSIDKARLSNKVLSVTREFPLASVAAAIKEKTYRTVLDSTELRETFAFRNTNMDRLIGIEPNAVRTYSGYDKPDGNAPKDEIDTVLLIARSYLEILGAEQTECSSINTATPIGYVIAKEETSQHLPFSSLRQITDIPDVGEAVLSRNIKISDLFKLRESRHWPAFKNWFHEKCSTDPISVARAYIELLKEVPTVDKTAGRTLRFLATTAMGFVHPAIGITAGVADAYLVPKVREASAKFFIEELEQLTDQQKSKA